MYGKERTETLKRRYGHGGAFLCPHTNCIWTGEKWIPETNGDMNDSWMDVMFFLYLSEDKPLPDAEECTLEVAPFLRKGKTPPNLRKEVK